eukprot:TRINITY_DN15009_c0_g1_i1.p1 TRINITY_DN15009_c0_g1~~TRINITY_DN15009_c0_g1_i1.p1  ORF type:complete len:340 (-),score=66.59 TRINITY_DN15009_c0_g1_i1:155-1174(-)
MEVNWGRIIGVCFGFILAIPAVFIRFTVRFITLGCGIFYVKTRSVPPQCLLDPKYGAHKFMTVNGVKLHYVESGDTSKPLLLFVHGWPQFWYSWRNQIEHFQENYHVVAMDMRGYNDSDKPAGIEKYFPKLIADDIKGLVEGLGEKKFTLVGHDWGGAISWIFAALYPEMLTNLIICNLPHPIALMDQRKKGWEQALKSWYIIFFQCPVLPELSMMAEDMASFNRLFKDNPNNDEKVKEAYRFAFRDYKTWNSTINIYRCTTMKMWGDFFKANKDKFKIKVRTLHIFGTADTALSVAAAKDSAAFVEDYRLELLEGVSHWVQEQEPEKVNSLIEKFLET